MSGVLWVCWLLKVLQASQMGPLPILYANQAARHIPNNHVSMTELNMWKWIVTL